MDDLVAAKLMTGALGFVLGGMGLGLFLPKATAWVRALPRARITGAVLSSVCWLWAGVWLWQHPIDFLAFLTPPVVVVGTVVCALLSLVLLQNLLCARAIGGLLMLWPMPVIVAVRDQLTNWRLVPISIGYVSLTLGMFIVFYPWIFRVGCEKVAEDRRIRQGLAWGLLAAAGATLVAMALLGKVVGE